MNYSEKHKLSWYAPIRTGCRSLQEIFKHLEFNDDFNHDFGIDLSKLDYRLIFNVRNPYSRVVSTYTLKKYHLQPSGPNDYSFEQFVKDLEADKEHYQFKYHEELYKITKPTYLIHTENLKDDLLKIPEILEISNTNEAFIKDFTNNILDNPYSRERNINNIFSESSDYWKVFYNKELSDIIYKNLSDQFTLWNYDPESWK